MLQAAELGAGLDADLLAQDATRPLIGAEGVGLPSTPIQGQHEQAPPVLAQRLLLDQPLDERDHGLGAGGGQPGCGQIVLGVEPHPLQAGRRAPGERVVLVAGERPAPPECQRLAQQLPSVLRPALVECPTTRVHQLLEPEHVDLVGRQVQHVARARGAQAAGAVRRVEQLPEPGHVDLQARSGPSAEANRPTARRPGGRRSPGGWRRGRGRREGGRAGPSPAPVDHRPEPAARREPLSASDRS